MKNKYLNVTDSSWVEVEPSRDVVVFQSFTGGILIAFSDEGAPTSNDGAFKYEIHKFQQPRAALVPSGCKVYFKAISGEFKIGIVA